MQSTPCTPLPDFALSALSLLLLAETTQQTSADVNKPSTKPKAAEKTTYSGNHAQADGGHLLRHGLVAAQIALGADQNDRNAERVVLDLRPPLKHRQLERTMTTRTQPNRQKSKADLALHVVEGVRQNDGIAGEENICLTARERAHAVWVRE